MSEDVLKNLNERITKLELFTQELEVRIANLENGEFGTGIYLDGCSDSDKEYITGREEKVGE